MDRRNMEEKDIEGQRGKQDAPNHYPRLGYHRVLVITRQGTMLIIRPSIDCINDVRPGALQIIELAVSSRIC